MIIQKTKPKNRGNAVKIGAVCFFVAVILLICYAATLSSKLLREDSTSSRVQPEADKNGVPAVSDDYPPLSCMNWLDEIEHHRPSATSDTTPFQDPNEGKKITRATDKYPFFTIALHDEQFDPARWSIVKWGHYYETALLEAFSTVLNATTSRDNQRPTRVLDVGANIGYFSLTAAGHGNVVVDAFEPNKVNAFRLCQSLQINHWLPNELEYSNNQNNHDYDKEKSIVNCHPYGVGKEVGNIVFNYAFNPGAGSFNHKPSATKDGDETQTDIIPVVTLDVFAASRNWFAQRPDIAILKVDVEGYELQVIHGAVKLLKSRLIRNIFMEVSARTRKEVRDTTECLKLIASSGYDVYQFGGFRGPQHTVNWSSQNVTQLTELVIHEVTKKKHKQMNLWWTLHGQQIAGTARFLNLAGKEKLWELGRPVKSIAGLG